MVMGSGNYNGRTLTLKNEQEMYEYEHSEQGFIDSLQGKSSLVQVHLLSGKWFVGKILGSDDHTILFSKKRDGNQMIYKTAITTISVFEDKNNGQ